MRREGREALPSSSFSSVFPNEKRDQYYISLLLYDAFIYACHVKSGVFLHTYELIYLLPYDRGDENGNTGFLCGNTTENLGYCRLSPITFITVTLEHHLYQTDSKTSFIMVSQADIVTVTYL